MGSMDQTTLGVESIFVECRFYWFGGHIPDS